MSSHRYWRIFIHTIVSGNDITAGEIEFRGEVGGPDLTGSGTAFSSGTPAVGYEAANAFNGVEETAEAAPPGVYWSLTGAGQYQYIGYDFGDGNDVDVNEVYYYPSRDVNRQPLFFFLQYSDDNVIWVTKGAARSQTGWVLGTPRTFDFTPATVSEGRTSWAIADNTGYVNGPAIEELEFRATPGGADQATGGTAAGSSQFSGTYAYANAFSNSVGNPWVTANGDAYGYIRYTLGAPIFVEQIMLRSDATFFARHPTNFSVLSSNDATIFRLEWHVTTNAWTPSETRLFSRPIKGVVGSAWFQGGVITTADLSVYTYNDFHITAPESLLRKLLIGVVHGIASGAVVPSGVTVNGNPAEYVDGHATNLSGSFSADCSFWLIDYPAGNEVDVEVTYGATRQGGGIFIFALDDATDWVAGTKATVGANVDNANYVVDVAENDFVFLVACNRTSGGRTVIGGAVEITADDTDYTANLTVGGVGTNIDIYYNANVGDGAAGNRMIGMAIPIKPTLSDTITSIVPNFGNEAGGTPVTITGFGFLDATGVLFDTDPADNVIVVDDNTITCETPAHVAGIVDVTVERPTTDIIAEDGFEFLEVDPPTLINVSPDEGRIDETTSVTLTGTDLIGTTAVYVNGVDVGSFNIVNETTITFDVPTSSVAGLVDVSIDHPYGNALLEDGFEYINVSRVTQIPLLVINRPVQAVRVTQVPLLVISLPIQDARVTQIPMLPVWTPKPIPEPLPIVPEVPVREAWSYKTVVTISENGREQRARLRPTPRVTLSFDIIIGDAEERRRVFDMLFKFVRRPFSFPTYHYSTVLAAPALAGATSLAFDASRIQAHAGGVLALFDPHLDQTHYVACGELTDAGATVSPLPFDVPATWLVCGVETFRTDPVIGLTMNAVTGSISFIMLTTDTPEFVNEFSEASITTYDGICLLANRPLANSGVDETFDQNVNWLDNGINAPEPVTNWAVPYISGKRAYKTSRPEGIHAWRAFVDHVKGRQNVFLLPTFRDDFPLIEQPALSSKTLKTSRIQYFDYWRDTAYRYLRIETANGVIYRRIIEVVANYDIEGNPVSLTLTLNTALGGAAGDNVIRSVGFMLLCRLDSDTIEVEHRAFDSYISLDIRGVSA